MKRRLLLAALLGSLPHLSPAKDILDGGGAADPSAAAVSVAKAHIKSLLTGKFAALEASYAPKVQLMPGHEFLKERYGVAGPKGRSAAVTIEQGKLLKVIRNSRKDDPLPPAEVVDKLLATLTYTPVKTAIGDFATDPADPVGTPDGKLHFTIEDGDVLIKVSPPKGDFLLLQYRKVAGTWKIVAEYLD